MWSSTPGPAQKPLTLGQPDDRSRGPQPVTRVLLASPVRQPRHILDHFLRSLTDLIVPPGHHLDFAFIDDGDGSDPTAATALHAIADGTPNTRVHLLDPLDAAPPYDRSRTTHDWTNTLVERVAVHKDRLIRLALEQGYDFVLLVDSDLVLHPETLVHLLAAQVDIVAEVFWTRWTPEQIELPNVWIRDQYSLTATGAANGSSDEAAQLDETRFLEKLAFPGLHEVGGLGACTLVSRAALTLRVNVSETVPPGETPEQGDERRNDVELPHDPEAAA